MNLFAIKFATGDMVPQFAKLDWNLTSAPPMAWYAISRHWKKRESSRANRIFPGRSNWLAEPIEERGLPLAGQIAAGVLHEAVEQSERVDFDEMFNPKNKNLFVLQVRGDSMIEDQIADGDFVVIQKQRTARKGQIVVAMTDEGEATLKRWFPEKNRIRLEPANSIDEAHLR